MITGASCSIPMKITKLSNWSGIEHTFDLPITAEQCRIWLGGARIQDAFPQLTASEREFLLTGIIQEEWETMMREDINLYKGWHAEDGPEKE